MIPSPLATALPTSNAGFPAAKTHLAHLEISFQLSSNLSLINSSLQRSVISLCIAGS
jgi:hypothetical protein